MTTENTYPNKQALEEKYRNLRNNLLLVVVFTLINIILLITQSNKYFLFSAYIPYAIVDIGMLVCGMYPDEFYGENFSKADTISPSMFAVFLAIALIMVILYLVSWIFSKKNKVGWMIFALAFFSVDTVLMLAIYGIQLDILIDILFHLWVIISLVIGINANSKLKKILPEEVEILESINIGEPQGNLQNSGIIRTADLNTKARIFLQTIASGHNITYRRVKNVKELVIDGNVYDEVESLVEYAHSLKAQIDGHLIEVGYDGRFHSYLKIDGQMVARKLRLF